MAFFHSRARFVKKHLDPADRLEEVLCGLIMVLDFTLIGGLTAGAGKQGVRHLLIAALGCNVAWGIIDGALYVMGNLTARRQRRQLFSEIRNICRAMLPVISRIALPEAGITKEDVYGWAQSSGSIWHR